VLLLVLLVVLDPLVLSPVAGVVFVFVAGVAVEPVDDIEASSSVTSSSRKGYSSRLALT
jgi:hypothetical protein